MSMSWQGKLHSHHRKSVLSMYMHLNCSLLALFLLFIIIIIFKFFYIFNYTFLKGYGLKLSACDMNTV